MIWNIHYVQIEYIKLLFCFSIVFIQISGFYHKLFGVPPFWILLWDPNQYKKWNLCNTVTFVILKCFHLTNSFVRGKNQRAAFFVADKRFFFLNKRCNFTRKFVRFWKWKGHFVFSRLHFSSLKKYVKWKQVKVTNMILQRCQFLCSFWEPIQNHVDLDIGSGATDSVAAVHNYQKKILQHWRIQA